MHKGLGLGLSKATMNLGIGSDPGLDPGLDLGFATFGSLHTTTHMLIHMASLNFVRRSAMDMEFLTSVRSNYEITRLLENFPKCLSSVDFQFYLIAPVVM